VREPGGTREAYYRPEIDGLRALAVICVVAFHVKLGPFSGGFIGVDVFFVISGFLITVLLWKR
jgi:peptidoglycan/LPS O-acetylase OafA/YrhL